MARRVSVSDLLRAGLIHPGLGRVSVRGFETCGLRADLLPGGSVSVQGRDFGSLSEFSRTFMRKPCNGWTHAVYREKTDHDWRPFAHYRNRYCAAIGSGTKPVPRQSLLYMLHPRACINGNESVYKIGKTRKPLRERLRGYTKGTEVVAQLPVPSELLDGTETAVLQALRRSFRSRNDYGNEYFEGDKFQMFHCVCEAVRHYQQRSQRPVSPCWKELCGQTLPTGADAVHYLYSVLLPNMNRWLEIGRDGGCTESYPDGTRVTRTVADTVTLHQNQWLGWATTDDEGSGGGRMQVVPQWLAWHNRRQKC